MVIEIHSRSSQPYDSFVRLIYNFNYIVGVIWPMLRWRDVTPTKTAPNPYVLFGRMNVLVFCVLDFFVDKLTFFNELTFSYILLTSLLCVYILSMQTGKQNRKKQSKNKESKRETEQNNNSNKRNASAMHVSNHHRSVQECGNVKHGKLLCFYFSM